MASDPAAGLTPRQREILGRVVEEYIAQCVKAGFKEVRIVHETGTAEVVVPDYQLSVAIGKEGQNARLAARLTGWRVDIKSETQLYEEQQAPPQEEEWAAGEWVTDESGHMVWQPAEGGEAVSASDAGYGEEEPKPDESIATTAEGEGFDAAQVEPDAGALPADAAAVAPAPVDEGAAPATVASDSEEADA